MLRDLKLTLKCTLALKLFLAWRHDCCVPIFAAKNHALLLPWLQSLPWKKTKIVFYAKICKLWSLGSKHVLRRSWLNSAPFSAPRRVEWFQRAEIFGHLAQEHLLVGKKLSCHLLKRAWNSKEGMKMTQAELLWSYECNSIHLW